MTPALQALIDRQAVADLLDDYATAVDTRDWELLASLFTADARLDYTSSGGPRGLRDEVLGWVRTALSAVCLTQHFLPNRAIRVEGDDAWARTQMLNPLVLDGDDAPQLFLLGGSYHDRLVRDGLRWRITERTHTVTWTAGPLSAQIPIRPG